MSQYYSNQFPSGVTRGRPVDVDFSEAQVAVIEVGGATVVGSGNDVYLGGPTDPVLLRLGVPKSDGTSLYDIDEYFELGKVASVKMSFPGMKMPIALPRNWDKKSPLQSGAAFFAAGQPRVYAPARDYDMRFLGVRSDGFAVALLCDQFTGEFVITLQTEEGWSEPSAAKTSDNVPISHAQYVNSEGGILHRIGETWSWNGEGICSFPIKPLAAAKNFNVPLLDPRAVTINFVADNMNKTGGQS